VSSPAGPLWIAVGRITRAHGIKGEMAVLPLSQIASRFQPGSRLFVGDQGDRPVTVSSSRPHRQRVLVSFEAVTDRTEAERLRGEFLFVPASSAPVLPDGEYWAHELIGCQAVTESGRPLGTIREVIHTPANDVWGADGEQGEVLIPALKDVVTHVDVAGKRIVTRDVPGLTAP
jgi:16S rRNA processing protein RimM